VRILVYGLNYSPELTGIGKYTGDMVQWLTTQGHDVRVITAPPYYPSWQVHPEYKSSRYKKEQLAGATVYRCPLWVPSKSTGITRILHLLSFMFSSLPVMLLQIIWRPKIIFMVSPTVLCAPVTMIVSTFTGAVSWLHVQDIEVDAAFEMGVLRTGGLVHWFARTFEKFFITRFHRVSSISPNMLQRIISKGVDEDKAVLFPNWVDTDAIYPKSGANYFRRELNIADDDVVLLYSGNMGMKQGLDVLCHLAGHFASENKIKFLFCGDGSFRKKLVELVSGLDNVHLLPLQPEERLNDLLNSADIHLLPQRAGAADLVMPSKLTGMLASGRPTITTAAVGTQLAIVVDGCGIVVPPAESAAEMGPFYAAVRELFLNAELRRTFGNNARAYAVQHMGRDYVLGSLANGIEKFIERPAADNVSAPQKTSSVVTGNTR